MMDRSAAAELLAPEVPAAPRLRAVPPPEPDAPADAFLDGTLKHKDLVASYSSRMIASSLGAAVLLTTIGTTVRLLLPELSWGGHPAIVWALLVLQLPLILWSRKRLFAADRPGFLRAYWVASLVQFVWLQLLCWVAGPVSWVVGIAMLLAWAFNDSWNFYDAPHVRAQYLVAIPAFDAVLLLVDLLGGHGLVHLFTESRGTFLAFVASQGIVTLMATSIVSLVGRHAREHDSRWAEHVALEHQLALLRREREIIQQSCTFLTKGLTASRFSHDVANPICVVTGNAALIEETVLAGPFSNSAAARLLRALPEQDRDVIEDAVAAWSTDLSEMAGEIVRASDQVMRMTSVLARSVRTRDPVGPRDAKALLAEAVEQALANAKAHGVEAPAPVHDLELAELHVTADHAASIATILTNGILQRPEAAVEVHGRRSGRWFYALKIRDFGVAPEARAEALLAIHRSLALRPKEDGALDAERTYRGYGIGLMLAKVLFLRYDGWLTVEEPDEGPGVVFRVVLPAADPALIPDDEKVPERA